MISQYSNTKLYDLWLALDLADELQPLGITVNAVHPGGVRTQLARNFSGVLKVVFAIMMPLVFISPEKGSATSVMVATDPDLADVTGQYFTNKKIEALKPIGTDVEGRINLRELTKRLLKKWL